MTGTMDGFEIDWDRQIPLYRFKHGPVWVRFRLDEDADLPLTSRFGSAWGVDLDPLFVLYDPREKFALRRAEAAPGLLGFPPTHSVWRVITLLTVNDSGGLFFLDGLRPPSTLTIPFLRWLFPDETPTVGPQGHFWPTHPRDVPATVGNYAARHPSIVKKNPGIPRFDRSAPELVSHRLLGVPSPILAPEETFIEWIGDQEAWPSALPETRGWV